MSPEALYKVLHKVSIAYFTEVNSFLRSHHDCNKQRTSVRSGQSSMDKIPTRFISVQRKIKVRTTQIGLTEQSNAKVWSPLKQQAIFLIH